MANMTIGEFIKDPLIDECNGCVSTLSKSNVETGNRFYKSSFFKRAMSEMDKLSLELCLEESGTADGDVMGDFGGDLLDDFWTDNSPDELFTEFFLDLKKDVCAHKEDLRKVPSQFVQLFNFEMGKFLARRKGDAKTEGFWDENIGKLFK